MTHDPTKGGEPFWLYHGMSSRSLPGVLSGGLSAPCFWGTEELACYYAAEAALEDGTEPVLLRVAIGRFDQSALHPDLNSLDTPLLSALDMDESEIADAWMESRKDWRASLRIVGAVLCTAVVRILPKDALRPDPELMEEFLGDRSGHPPTCSGGM